MMTPEEIKQIVEDYRKSSNLNELRIRIGDKFDIDTRNFLRNRRDQVNTNNKNNNKGAQGTQDNVNIKNNNKGAQGTQDNVNIKNNNKGAQGNTTNGAQGNTTNGAQGNTTNGAQGNTTNGAQGAQSNVNVKNKYKEVDQETFDKKIKDIDAAGGINPYIKNLKRDAKNDSLNIKDMMKYSSTNTSNIDSNTFKEKPPGYYKNLVNNKDNKDNNNKTDTSASGKLNLVKVPPLKNDSPAANAGIPLETRKNLALKNAAFNMSKNKNSEYSRADFRKDFPNSFSAKEFNKRKLPPRVTDYSSYDPYETLLGYVLSEGHADSVEEAHYVMMQMDEETIKEFIKKAALIGTGLFLGHKGLKKAGDAFNNYLNNLRNNSTLGGNKRVDDVRKGSGDPNVGKKINFGAGAQGYQEVKPQ